MTMLKVLFSLSLLMLNPFVLIPIIIVVVILVRKNKEYKEGAYYQITKRPYLSVRRNTGQYGEYLTYKYLKYMEGDGARFLFNVYIPKDNGETTEIDVLMICSKGIFVFESKNYSGWIFGNENQKKWCQTLPAGRGRSHKEYFYNPVMQNRSHIKHLKTFLGEQVSVRSIIVFSDRCTLKNIQIQNNDIRVINRYNIAPVVSTICNQTPTDQLTENEISEIYTKLYPFTQVNEIEKAQHIANIRNNLNNSSAQRVQPIYSPTAVQIAEIPKPAPILQTDIVSADSDVDNGEETSTVVAELNAIQTLQQEPQALKCPWCNGNLIIRTATRGINVGNQFYGCSNYPKCKYIQNIKNK